MSFGNEDRKVRGNGRVWDEYLREEVHGYGPIEHRGGEIRLPMSPSRWVGEERRYTVACVWMSCGGGMGGSRWDEYLTGIGLEDIRLLMDTGKAVVAENIYGEDVLLSPDYIVKAQMFDVVERDYDTGNDNFYPKRTVRILLPLGKDVWWRDC